MMIRAFTPADQPAVIGLILAIQQNEFGVPITAGDQPDLLAIPDFYQSGGGAFLVAEVDGRIVGTIALRDSGDGSAALRKMFVAADHRGPGRGVARALLTALLAHARERGVRTILLGTHELLQASHRFYERNGFVRVEPERLPASFPRMAVDTRFYRLDLGD